MKRIIYSLGVMVLWAGWMSISLAETAKVTARVTVNGMVCAFCAQGIEKRLSKLPATQAVWVNLKQKTVAVEAKEGMTLDEKTIRAEIVDSGYDVVKFEVVPESIAHIKSVMAAGSKP